MRGVLNTAGQLWASLDNLINDRPIKVAVTGLSRSGKTVFLTSLIANLLAMGTGRPTMPALRAHIDKAGKDRLRNVRLVPARASTTPRFDYLGKLADLAAAQPKWPARTEDLAEIELELEIRAGNGLLGQMRALSGTPRLRLELLDYPGEWLLDLPLLNLSYRAMVRRNARPAARKAAFRCRGGVSVVHQSYRSIASRRRRADPARPSACTKSPWNVAAPNSVCDTCSPAAS